MSDVEQRLRLALAPVEPPGTLTDRFERALTEITGAAADELADWELRAMRDPRNWIRPAAAVVGGGLAGVTLLIVRTQLQRRRRGRSARALDRAVRDPARQVGRSVRDPARQLGRRLGR